MDKDAKCIKMHMLHIQSCFVNFPAFFNILHKKMQKLLNFVPPESAPEKKPDFYRIFFPFTTFAKFLFSSQICLYLM